MGSERDGARAETPSARALPCMHAAGGRVEAIACQRSGAPTGTLGVARLAETIAVVVGKVPEKKKMNARGECEAKSEITSPMLVMMLSVRSLLEGRGWRAE